ncbi:MAG: hypothetical protein ACJAZP_001334 [Psychromonas sp.]|jgi:hypothetical protein|uniref:hypothetical protein n=1 Tax=Psychromonas sp. TaxID=1884585 RepID=UPI0039E61B6F
MRHFKPPETCHKYFTGQRLRMLLLLFMVLLSSQLSGNELPAHGQELQIIIHSRTLPAAEQNRSLQTSQTLQSRANQSALLGGNTMALAEASFGRDLNSKIGFWLLLVAATFWIIERHFIHLKRANPWQGGVNEIYKS